MEFYSIGHYLGSRRRSGDPAADPAAVHGKGRHFGDLRPAVFDLIIRKGTQPVLAGAPFLFLQNGQKNFKMETEETGDNRRKQEKIKD